VAKSERLRGLYAKQMGLTQRRGAAEKPSPVRFRVFMCGQSCYRGGTIRAYAAIASFIDREVVAELQVAADLVARRLHPRG